MKKSTILLLFHQKQISFVRNTEEEQEKVHQIVLEEIALLHRIKHPNIVSCLGATQHEAHYNLFMELMSGICLVCCC